MIFLFGKVIIIERNKKLYFRFQLSIMFIILIIMLRPTTSGRRSGNDQ